MKLMVLNRRGKRERDGRNEWAREMLANPNKQLITPLNKMSILIFICFHLIFISSFKHESPNFNMVQKSLQ